MNEQAGPTPHFDGSGLASVREFVERGHNRCQSPHVHHGGPRWLAQIEPSIPLVRANSRKDLLASRTPVICATPVVEIAVAHAILSRAVFEDDDRFFFAWDPYRWADGRGVPLIATTTYVLEEMTRRKMRGVLHSFSMQDFEPEWHDRPLAIEERCYGGPIEPCARHEVSVADLTSNLVLIDDRFRHMAAMRIWPMMTRDLAWAREKYFIEPLGGDWSELLP